VAQLFLKTDSYLLLLLVTALIGGLVSGLAAPLNGELFEKAAEKILKSHRSLTETHRHIELNLCAYVSLSLCVKKYPPKATIPPKIAFKVKILLQRIS
jgi:hypothetical protein